MATENRQSGYITEAREHARRIYSSISALKTMQSEFNYGGYGPQGANPLPDGQGDNEGVTAAQVGAVIFDTTDALKGLLDGGHGANIAALL
jgi:hypothetical protein